MILTAAAIGCGARTGTLGDVEQELVPDAATPEAGPRDASPDTTRDAPGEARDAGADVACDACVRILTYDDVAYYEIHAPEGTIQQVGPSPDGFFGDIALSKERTLYAGAYGGLAVVDMTSWKTTSKTPTTGPNQMNALEFGADGTLYGAELEGVYTIDVGSGQADLLATLPGGLHSAGDVAFVGSRLFMSAFITAFNVLVEIDLTAKKARVVGDTGSQCIFGLVGTDTALYGVTCNAELLELDPATGAAKTLARYGSHGFYGATRL